MPAIVVTATSRAPADPAGAVAVICVSLTTTMLVAATPPTVTPGVPAKPVPVRVSASPPVVGPDAGDRAVTIGVV